MFNTFEARFLTALLLGLLIHCGGGRTDVPLTPLEPLVTSQPQDQAVKAPASATFAATVSGNPAPTYQWTLDGVPIPGATSNTYTTPGTDSSMTGRAYALVATNSLGSVTSAPAVLTVTGPPVITAQPAAITVRVGERATFTVAAAGAGGLTYRWSRDGSALDDATAATYTTSAATREMTDARYTVEVTSPSGSVTSSPAVLTVAYGPTIKVQPATENVLSPAPATFRVEAEGNPLAYQWNRNGTPIVGATSASWTIPASTIAMNGDLFTVTVSCAGTSVTSAPAALNVTSVPVITTQPLGRSLPAGTAFTLSVEAVGLPNLLAYQWNRNGEALPGATAASYTVDRATAEDSGSYTVTVTNGAGSTESQKAIVQVAAGYTVSGTVTAGGAGVTGAVLTLDTNPARTATTDSNGAYTLSHVPPGSYTLTPSIPAFSSVFAPTSRPVTVVAGDVEASFTATLGYTVSGVITNSDPDSGTIYLTLRPAGEGFALGEAHLDLAGGHAFAFRGVPPGTYTLSGRADLFDKGTVNAHDPSGTLAAPVTVAAANVTGLTLPLAPAVPDLSALAAPAFSVSAMDSGAVIDYRPVTSGGVEQPRSYQLDWSTDPAFASLSGTRRVTPSPAHLVVLSGDSLVNGTTYHVRMRGLGVASATAWSASRAVTVGAGTGAFSASGTVSFATPPEGPLLVGMRDPATGRAWMTRIQAPASPQAFAVSGVPASTPGAFELVAFLDQDLNGLLSLGDPARTLPAVVASDLRDQALVLPSTSCTAAVTTRHARYGDTETCTLLFTVRDGANHVASAQLSSGPNLPMPASLGAGNGGSVLTFEATPTARPTAGDAYTIVVNFYDGTTETLTVQVTGVLDAFPELQAPDLQGAGSPGDLEPAFAWAAPLAPPPSYHYDFTLKGSGVSWTVTGLPSTTTTLDWSVDPGDSANTVTGGLTARVPCTWTLALVDASGNSAQVARTYTP